MKHASKIIVAILSLVGIAALSSASAQNAVGGIPKHSPVGGPASIGGPVKQSSPVIPANKVGSAPVAPPTVVVKCAAGSCPPKALPNPGLATPHKPNIAVVPPRSRPPT